MRCFTDSTSLSLACPRAWTQDRAKHHKPKGESGFFTAAAYVDGFQLPSESSEHSVHVVLLILVLLKVTAEVCQLQLSFTNLQKGTVQCQKVASSIHI